MGGSGLAVVIPARNEAATIGDMVAAAAEHGLVIVVDDRSTDATAERARAAGAVVVPSDAGGYDDAIDAGFREAEHRGRAAVVTMDADGEHDPGCLPAFAALLIDAGTPLVLGVRDRKPRWAEVLLGLAIRRTFGVSDILCGMKGYGIGLRRENGGFDHVGSIGTELALNAIRRGHRFAEVAVTGGRRSDASRFGGSWQANWRILKAVGRAYAYGRRAARTCPAGADVDAA